MLSKQIKEPVYRWLVCSFLGDIYGFFYTRIKRLKRMFAYAKFGYTNYDYEGQFIYPLLSFKFKRIKKCLINGIAVQQQVDMDALDEASTICDRLFGEDYEAKYMVAHDAKWGKITFTFEPNFQSHRKNRNTKEEKDQEWKEHFEIMDKAEEDRRKDVDRLAEIMKVNLPACWD